MRNAVLRGEGLHIVRIGRLLRYRVEDIEAWIEAYTSQEVEWMNFFPLNKWRAYQLCLLDPRLNPCAQSVFGRLLEHHNTRTGLFCPSEERIAEALNCSPRSVGTAIRTLKKTEFVSVRRGQGIGGANKYVLYIPSGKKEFEEAKKRITWRKKTAAKPTNEIKKKPKKESGVVS